ncbi:unnamed protein product [Tuber aestivum]|uniref:Uncharacterized protein n=1 Tax=Tuber aestivum TaxID=59557 RepID=A0A292Q0B4_9PEZI|nr:unnamed protein product [Tuber aestivum]
MGLTFVNFDPLLSCFLPRPRPCGIWWGFPEDRPGPLAISSPAAAALVICAFSAEVLAFFFNFFICFFLAILISSVSAASSFLANLYRRGDRTYRLIQTFRTPPGNTSYNPTRASTVSHFLGILETKTVVALARSLCCGEVKYACRNRIYARSSW